MDTVASGLELFLVRVGDAERDACIELLTEHHVRGRLSVEEFERRQSAALNAVTVADLAALVADLPGAALPLGQPLGQRSAPGNHGPEAALLAVSPSARTAALRAGPAALVVAASAVLAASLPSEGMFAGMVATGVIGYAAHSITARVRRRPAR